MKNILVTGGGSGGHMYPALAIAEKFNKNGYNVYYVGGEELESLVWPKDEFPFLFIHSSGREFGGIKELFQIFYYNIKGINDSLKIIKKYKPIAVIGTGGYVEFPLILAAKLKGIPSFIQEQNAIPGRANLFLERFSKKVFLGFKEAESDFKDKSKMVFSGNPIREVFKEKNRNSSREQLGYDSDEFIILLTGGSLGAPRINELAIELAQSIQGEKGLRMILSTGERYYKRISKQFEDKEIKTGRDTNIEVYEYIDNMADYLTLSNFVIERSGAVSVAETISKGIPSLMIPSTYVYKNHQFYNAKVVADYGATILLEEKDLDISSAVHMILDIIKDKERLDSMSEKALELSQNDSLDIIFNCVEDVLNANK